MLGRTGDRSMVRGWGCYSQDRFVQGSSVGGLVCA